MRGIKAKAEKLGNLVIVGNGTVAHARDFDKTHGKGLRSLVDTNKATYDALHFKHGVSATMSARSVRAAFGPLSRGHIQTATKGDALQMGGVLVVAAGGHPVFFQCSEFAGDHARLEDIVKALKEAMALPESAPKKAAKKTG